MLFKVTFGVYAYQIVSVKYFPILRSSDTSLYITKWSVADDFFFAVVLKFIVSGLQEDIGMFINCIFDPGR